MWRNRDKINFRPKGSFYKEKVDVVDDAMYIVNRTSLLSLDMNNGKKLWQFKTGGFLKEEQHIDSGPEEFMGNIIFATGRIARIGKKPIKGSLYSINARTGKLK